MSGPIPEGWKSASSVLTQQSGKKQVATQQQLFSVKDLQDAGDSEAEAMMDPTHPDGFWGTWVDGPRPDSNDAARLRTPGRSSSKLHARPHAHHPMPEHVTFHHPDPKPFGSKGLPTAGQLFHSSKGKKQSLAAVDLGSESYAEALMDPSHPSGEWGTWVDPSTSARSVIGEKQFEAYTSGLRGLDKQTVDAIHRSQANIASAVAKSRHNGFGMPSPTGLGGRYGGEQGGAMADMNEAYEMGQLLDSSSA